MKILVINGPNMLLLGRRRKDFYGSTSWAEIESSLRSAADKLGVEIDFFQSNHEGDLCDRIASTITEDVSGIVINPAAYTHTSIAVRDALEAAAIPAIEVHLSNVAARDDFRKVSLTAPVCVGQITGLGPDVYYWALQAVVRYVNTNKD